MTVDLFLNGPLGAWVLDQVDARDVGMVHSPDHAIAEKARAIGMWAHTGNINQFDYNWSGGGIGLSMHYPYIIKPEILHQYSVIYNIHPGLLPWGRCYYPVFWALWADEPAGCTLHVIDEGVDTGNICYQLDVPKYDWDTGGSLHRRVSDAEKALFLDWWPRIVEGFKPEGVPQIGDGSYHSKQSFFDLKREAQTGQMGADEVLRLIRCLSHEQYTGMIVSFGGRTYEISARPVGW